eukprot:3143956-Prymnesium_polylepis.1
MHAERIDRPRFGLNPTGRSECSGGSAGWLRGCEPGKRWVLHTNIFALWRTFHFVPPGSEATHAVNIVQSMGHARCRRGSEVLR